MSVVAVRNNIVELALDEIESVSGGWLDWNYNQCIGWITGGSTFFGGALGGGVGFYTGGPWGAVYGARNGAAFGSGIGYGAATWICRNY